MIDYKLLANTLRYGGDKACETCPIKTLDSYTCAYPETLDDEGTTCAILTDALDALEAAHERQPH